MYKITYILEGKIFTVRSGTTKDVNLRDNPSIVLAPTRAYDTLTVRCCSRSERLRETEDFSVPTVLLVLRFFSEKKYNRAHSRIRTRSIYHCRTRDVVEERISNRTRFPAGALNFSIDESKMKFPGFRLYVLVVTYFLIRCCFAHCQFSIYIITIRRSFPFVNIHPKLLRNKAHWWSDLHSST